MWQMRPQMPQTRHATDRGLTPHPLRYTSYPLTLLRAATSSSPQSPVIPEPRRPNLPYAFQSYLLIRPIRPIGLIRHVVLSHTFDGRSRHIAELNHPLLIRPIRPIGLIRHVGLPHTFDSRSLHTVASNLPPSYSPHSAYWPYPPRRHAQ